MTNAPRRGAAAPYVAPVAPEFPVPAPAISRRDPFRGASAARFAARAASAGLPASRAMPRTLPAPAIQGSTGTLTLVTDRVPSELDPPSAYDAGSGVAWQGPCEGHLCLQPGTADEIEPVLAVSWSANADGTDRALRAEPGPDH